MVIAHQRYCKSISLQINRLGETEAETAIDAEDDIFVFIFLTILLTGARNRSISGLSGEPPGEVSSKRSEGLASSTRPVAGVPRATSVWPSITTGSSMVALKVSPACDDALESALCRRIGMGVPSGSFVADGISAWLGEMPVECGGRSKGSFCESAGFEALSPVGRPQPHMKLSITRTMAMRWAGDAISFSIM